MVGDELVDHFGEGIAYTILPFASLSALALLAALAVLSRHEELEEENRLAGLREVYYQGLRQEQAQVRALRHDMRNHLSALLGQVDPRLMQLGLGLMKNCRERDDRNAALLRALRPFVKEERRAGLDRALQIVGVTRIIRAALETMGGKGEEGRV